LKGGLGGDWKIEKLRRNPIGNRAILRASAHNYEPNNGTSRKIDFAHFLPIDWP